MGLDVHQRVQLVILLHHVAGGCVSIVATSTVGARTANSCRLPPVQNQRSEHNARCDCAFEFFGMHKKNFGDKPAATSRHTNRRCSAQSRTPKARKILQMGYHASTILSALNTASACSACSGNIGAGMIDWPDLSFSPNRGSLWTIPSKTKGPRPFDPRDLF